MTAITATNRTASFGVYRARLVFALALLVAVAAVTAWWPWPAVGHLAVVATRGVSMEPGFQTGDLAILGPAADYDVGDVAAYYSDLLDTVVMHRIIARNGEIYTFQGDNNSWVDPERVTKADLRGKLWLRVPRGGSALGWAGSHLGLLAAAAAVAAGGTASATRRGRVAAGGTASAIRRGRTRRARPRHAGGRPPRPAQPFLTAGSLRDVTLGAGAVTLLCALLGVVAFGRPASTASATPVAYQRHGELTYQASVPAGPAYTDGRVDTGEPVFLRLVPALDIAYTYRLSADAPALLRGTLGLDAEVSDATGWRLDLVLQPPAPFVGDHATATGVLDLAALRATLDEVSAQTGISMANTTIAITPRVRVEGSLAGQDFADAVAPSFDLRLDQQQLRPEPPVEDAAIGEPLAATSENAAELPTVEPAQLKIAARHIDVGDARQLAVVLGLLAGAVTAASAIARRRRKAPSATHPETAHGTRVLTALDIERGASGTTIELASLEDLAQLAADHDRPLLRRQDSGATTYLVEIDRTIYRHRSTPTLSDEEAVLDRPPPYMGATRHTT